METYPFSIQLDDTNTTTSGSVIPPPYKKNVNLKLPYWLHNLCITISIGTLSLALFTIMF